MAQTSPLMTVTLAPPSARRSSCSAGGAWCAGDLQPDPRPRPYQPMLRDQRPAHVVALGPEHQCSSARPHLRTGRRCPLSRSLSGLLRCPLRWIPASSGPFPSASPRSPPTDRRCPPTPPRPCCPDRECHPQPGCRASAASVTCNGRATSLCQMRSTFDGGSS